jgi:hypothetical protein
VADGRGVAVTFESVDGPPAQIVQAFMRDLNEEAAARQIAVLPRGSAAPYRIRGYLAANPEGQPPAIAWAWDVYDGDQRRAFRLTGAEPIAVAGRGTSWAAADDAALRRIARAGIEQLIGFITTARTASLTPDAPPPRRASIVAMLDDFRPEAAGIFRILSSQPMAVVPDFASEAWATAVPLPRDRPPPSNDARSALAYSNPAE